MSNMFRLPTAILTALLLAVAAPCQDAKLKTELKTKETAAKKDPDQMFEVAKWANEKSLSNDAKRIFQAILKIKPDHAGANEAIGNQLVEGKWMPAKEAEALRKKALAAEFAAKGFVEVNGVWVEKDKADDAKRGVFHHEGDVVTKEELIAFQTGKVRHPDTGELIDAKNLEKAKSKYYPVGSDRWVDLKEADTWHSDLKRPWIVRTTKGLIISTLGLAKIEELKFFVDQGIDQVSPLLGGKVVAATRRPLVFIAATESEFRDLGQQFGDGTDACGAYIAAGQNPMTLPLLGEVHPAICFNHKDWGQRYIRHCAAISYAHGVAEEAGIDLPLWMLHGIGAYTSRFQNDSDAGWFGKQHQQKGGVRNLKSFFAGFAISGEMESTAIDYNMYQAGLLLAYAVKGGDPKVTETMQAVTAALGGTAKGGFDKAVTKLQTQLIEAEPKVAAYMQQLIAKAP